MATTHMYCTNLQVTGWILVLPASIKYYSERYLWHLGASCYASRRMHAAKLTLQQKLSLIGVNEWSLDMRTITFVRIRRSCLKMQAGGSNLFSVQDSWQQTSGARHYINPLLKRNKRKHFGKGENFVCQWTLNSCGQEYLRSHMSKRTSQCCTRSCFWLEGLVWERLVL